VLHRGYGRKSLRGMRRRRTRGEKREGRKEVDGSEGREKKVRRNRGGGEGNVKGVVTDLMI
jgi:hypothetical protein